MSVEKQVASTANKDEKVVHTEVPVVVHVEGVPEESSKKVVSAPDEIPVDDLGLLGPVPRGKMDDSEAARSWLADLTSEERADAVSFEDGAFLATFFGFAAPWSSETRQQPVVKTEWATMVSLDAFEAEYVAFGSDRTPKLSNKKTAIKADPSSGDEDKKEDTALRIPVSSAGKPSSGDGASLAFADNMFEQVSFIFPSAFKHISGSDVRYPHVIVRPAYFDRMGDEFLQASARAKFLSFECFEESSPQLSWLRRLGNKDGATVPLYSLLLARFEWAAWQSFLRSDRRRSDQPGYTTVDIEGKTISKQPKMEVLLGDIFSHCRAMGDLTMTIDSKTLEDFVAPLSDALTFALRGGVENVIFTPMSWVMFCRARSGPTSIDLLDKAVYSSLRRMEDHGASISPPALEAEENQTHDASGYGGSSKKKKKKNKKRKNKKRSGSNSSGASKPAQPLDAAVAEVTEKPSPAEIVSVAETHLEAKPQEKVSDVPATDHVEQPQYIHPAALAEVQVAASFDSDDTVEEPLVPLAIEAKVEDAAGIVVVSSGDAATEKEPSGEGVNNDDGDTWETVEVRTRVARKKPFDRAALGGSFGGSRQPYHGSSVSILHESHGGNGKKMKSVRTAATRKKVACRKMVREILFSIIDTVDEESRKSKPSIPSPPRAMNSWKNGPPGNRQPQPQRQQQPPARKKDFASVVGQGLKKEPVSMRDALLSKPRAPPITAPPKREAYDQKVDRSAKASPKKMDVTRKESPGKRLKNLRGAGDADQSTAPTNEETVSAVSASSDVRPTLKERLVNSDARKSDSSGEETEGVPLNPGEAVLPKVADELAVPAPPLPSLLNPENANSASSSVASSLEAPHAGRLHHHTITTAIDFNDVGYHLLDVCDRLSRDMSLFMSRRALALSARRRERGALLTALQNSVSSIWPGRCHVELYGSCATQLDLPSSDLDVVILGLDSNPEMIMNAQTVPVTRSKSGSSENLGLAASTDDTSVPDEAQQQSIQQRIPAAPYGRQANSERVVRLGADLEAQPWAVQVNAIPTASVPVIKVLADPSRLGDWIAHHQHLAAQAAAAAGKCQIEDEQSDEDQPKVQKGYPQPTLLPWRGSDVMKGLLSIDITFEGPEHGGIGSTEFSSHVVAEACAEAGLHPDATPLVQVVMVLKELLAQRKLNEPYSGGLSSYALLLLVVALIRERAVIREEIEHVEQQKKAMAATEMNSFGAGSGTVSYCSQSWTPLQQVATQDSTSGPLASTPKEVCIAKNERDPSHISSKNPQPKKNKAQSNSNNSQQQQAEPAKSSVPPPAFSWANIAKKTPGTKGVSEPHVKSQGGDSRPQKAAAKPAKKPTFADAVSKSTRAPFASTLAAAAKTKKREEVADAKEASRETKPSDRPPRAASIPSLENIDSVASPKRTSAPLQNSPSLSSLNIAPPFYPQGYNDIVEVLCSGETTAGKLLMHFLLYYGQHFDAQSTSIDISGKHERNFAGLAPPYSYYSPYIQRQAPGTIDPITGMLTVDPIVIYDPLEGAENNNVAKRCFAWNSVRWIFAQSYMTLASAVERSASPPSTPGGSPAPSPATNNNDGREREAIPVAYNPDAIGDLMDPSSPLLRCLLSF